MSWWRKTLVVLGLLLMAAPGIAAAQTLAVPGGGNNQSGIMFDVSATNDVTITGFTLVQVYVSDTYQVYGRPGVHVGFENAAGSWTLLASGAMNSGSDVVFPSALFFQIPAGQTYSLYITGTGAGNFVYGNGTAVGAVRASDANIAVHDGTGRGLPAFESNVFTPRHFTGSIDYAPGLVSPPAVVPTMTEWVMILFGLLLAAGAVMQLGGRRRA